MQSTINFDSEIAPDKLWVVAQHEEIERYKNVRRADGSQEMQKYTVIRAYGCVCGSNGMPLVFTSRGEATVAAIVLSENMSDQLRAFKGGSLKMEVTA